MHDIEVLFQAKNVVFVVLFHDLAAQHIAIKLANAVTVFSICCPNKLNGMDCL